MALVDELEAVGGRGRAARAVERVERGEDEDEGRRGGAGWRPRHGDV